MDKILYIHVGLHKTGTTAIQNFLAINREFLNMHGVLYPGKSENHYTISEELRLDCKAYLNEKTETNKIFSEIFQKQQNFDIFIISSEGFLESWELTIPSLSEAIKYFNLSLCVKIIVYLRPQIAWIESIYQQRVKQIKTRVKLTIEQFIENENIFLFNHYEILKFLSKTFGKENLIIKIHPFNKIENKIFDDFISLFNITTDNYSYLYPNFANLNIGLPKESIEFLRWLNILEINDLLFLAISNILSQQESNNAGNYYFLSNEKANEIIKYYSEINRKITDEFLFNTEKKLLTKEEIRTPEKHINQYNYEVIDIIKQIEIINKHDHFLLLQLYQTLMKILPKNEEIIKLRTLIQNSILNKISHQEIEQFDYLGSSFEAEDLINSFENIETIFKIDSDNFILSSFNYSPEIKLKISNVKKEVQIVSSGDDPYFQIINFWRSNTQAYLIKMTICSPEDTLLKVYFQIFSNPVFNESNTIITNLIKGENVKFILITNSSFNGNIRIDPGTTAGLYVINEIHISMAQLL